MNSVDGISSVEAAASLAEARRWVPAASPAPPSRTSGPAPAQSKASGPSESYAKFRIDSETKIVTIQIVDGASGEVIREIPPEVWVRLHKNAPAPTGTLLEAEL